LDLEFVGPDLRPYATLGGSHGPSLIWYLLGAVWVYALLFMLWMFIPDPCVMHAVSLDLDVIQEPNPEYFVPLMKDASTAVKFGFTETGSYRDFPSLCSACDLCMD